MLRKIVILAITFSLFLAGCNTSSTPAPAEAMDNNAVMTAAAATAFAKLTEVAALPTDTPLSTSTFTPEPPTITPTPTVEVTLVPMDALCIDNSRVRSWPGKGGEFLGGIFYGRGVKVLARNDKGNWLLIEFPDAAVGRGWVLSGGLQLKDDVSKLAIALERPNNQLVFVAPPAWTVVGTPLPLPVVQFNDSSRPATVTQASVVRICPTTSCKAIGYLQINDKINMTGRWGDNEWAQFEFPSGPGGRGWVVRENIQPSDAAFGGLPYFDLLGNLITPEPPTATPDPNMSPTPTQTATAVPPGPLVEITNVTSVYTLMSSLSPVAGTLNAKDRVRITAQSLNHLWYEIQYPVDSDGRAYISAKYVQLLPGQDYRYLHYTDAQGTPLPTP